MVVTEAAPGGRPLRRGVTKTAAWDRRSYRSQGKAENVCKLLLALIAGVELITDPAKDGNLGKAVHAGRVRGVEMLISVLLLT